MAENSERSQEEELQERKRAEAALRSARDHRMRSIGFRNGFLVGILCCVLLFAGGVFWLFHREIGMLAKQKPYRAEQSSASNASENPKDLNYSKIEAKMRLLQNVIYKNFLFDEHETEVEDGIYKGMLSGLGDPYSVYYTADEYKKLTEETSGKYSGIGAVLNQDP